jgi:hypothetical protein
MSLMACTRAIILISTAESALAGIAAPVPVGSEPELSRKRTEPQRGCPACGTYLHGLNAPRNNLPIRRSNTVSICVRPASDLRTPQLPRHDSAVQLSREMEKDHGSKP